MPAKMLRKERARYEGVVGDMLPAEGWMYSVFFASKLITSS